MSEDGITMRADKGLTDDLNKATTFEEIQMLLHNAVERSPEVGFTRDPVTGQFVRRDPLTPAEQDAANKAAADKAAVAPREFKKTETIAGRKFEFVGDSAESIERQLRSARSVAEAFAADEAATPRGARYAAAARNAEQDALDKVDADMKLRRGEITTAEYLERTHAIEDALEARGVNIDAVAAAQSHASWSEASEIFRNTVGADWPGGEKNRQILGDKLAAMGLVDAEDKVAAMAQAWAAMKSTGTLFEGDVSREQAEQMTAKMSPQEILEQWKAAQASTTGDASEANNEFIRIHNGGSGIFNS
jgi:hypothetical protein